VRVALVHDWLTGMRGGEKVLEVLCELYPEADILTLLHIRGAVSPRIESHRIRTSWVQRLPFAARHYRRYLPLFPAAIGSFDLSAYDLAISTSHCVAKSVIPGPRTRHLCYCFSPMRYAWDQFDAYFGVDRVGFLANRLVYRPIMSRIARWDAATASRAHRFVAISRHVSSRIARYYKRTASVVYPPVDTAFYRPAAVAPETHFLIVSALVPYKRVDLAIAACRRAGARLRIVGDGPERGRLERMSDGTVTFLGALSNEAIRDEYHRALAFILPGEEDFGIATLEAQACGRPVVALARGGALETVIDGDTGVLVDQPTAAAMSAGLERVATLRVDGGRIRAHAERFSRERHVVEMRRMIDETISAPAGSRW
jgi:glycosyltransferase involved in cell wall biosynthesis